MKLDKKGYFSSEIIILIIVLILIIGLISNLNTLKEEEISEKIEHENIEKISKYVCNYLINNPGNPQNWEKLDNINNIKAGLAIVNENNKTISNSVSYDKLNILSKNYNKLIKNNFFNGIIKSNIEIYPLNSEIPPIFIGESVNGNNIYSINKLIKCDFLSKFTKIKFNTDKPSNCFENHSSNYICKNFKFFKSNMKYNDYYLLSDKNTINKNIFWKIDTTKNKSGEFLKLNNEKTYLNDIIENKLKNDNESLFFIHIKDKSENLNLVFIEVPKSLDKNFLKFDYFIVNDCNMIFKTSY